MRNKECIEKISSLSFAWFFVKKLNQERRLGNILHDFSPLHNSIMQEYVRRLDATIRTRWTSVLHTHQSWRSTGFPNTSHLLYIYPRLEDLSLQNPRFHLLNRKTKTETWKPKKKRKREQKKGIKGEHDEENQFLLELFISYFFFNFLLCFLCLPS